MARIDELLQGAKIILDDLYTTDNDLNYIIDMALKKVSTDAPILTRELRIEAPPEVVNFGLAQGCIDDEIIDCSYQNKKRVADVVLNANINIYYKIAVGGNYYFNFINNTGSDIKIHQKDDEHSDLIIPNGGSIFASSLVLGDTNITNETIDVKFIADSYDFLHTPITCNATVSGTSFNLIVRNTNTLNKYLLVLEEISSFRVENNDYASAYGNDQHNATRMMAVKLVENNRIV